ncbi:hypothetical protein CEXT_141761 [Caerostris extrusa]|uniref:Uncharacterized protein n=1 Tax=Caerostris extrusa TaxID=172846 RepID=A0AAV4X9Y2_CAEEX|nr:hypothetical protein CEXT_141761 [Caerostris extrusa]
MQFIPSNTNSRHDHLQHNTRVTTTAEKHNSCGKEDTGAKMDNKSKKKEEHPMASGYTPPGYQAGLEALPDYHLYCSDDLRG